MDTTDAVRTMRSMLLYALLACAPALAHGQEEETSSPQADEQAIHQDLRAMRDELTKAVIAGDTDKQLQYAHSNIVVTWPNNDVVRGRDGLKEYMDRMNIGENGVFRGYKVTPVADEPTILYGDNFGVVFGKSVPQYKIAGMEFELENRWTATLVREGDDWRLASYHVSGNILDNAVLDVAKRSVYWVGGLAFVLGMVLGAIAISLARRGRRQSS